MTKFGVQAHNAHILKKVSSNHPENEDEIKNQLKDISIKPITLRKPNQLKPLKMLHEVQQEALNLYDISRIQKQLDQSTHPIKTSKNNTINNATNKNNSRDNIDDNKDEESAENIPKFILNLNDIKTRDTDKEIFEKFTAFRKESNSKLTEFVERINNLPLTLIQIYKNKCKVKFLYETFMKCRRVIELDVAQLEFTLNLFPVEVYERVCQIHANFYEQIQQQLNVCNDINMTNLSRLFELRAYLHQVFETIFVVISKIAKEDPTKSSTLQNDPTKSSTLQNDPTMSSTLQNDPFICKPSDFLAAITNSFTNSSNNNSLNNSLNNNTFTNSLNNSTNINLRPPNEEVNINKEGDKKIENSTAISDTIIETPIDLDALLYPKLMDYNFNYQFNRDILKQMLEKLTDESSKQQFNNENGGASRQILNKEIVVEINRLGGFDLHLKTIQPILKRLFPRPEELDPESRSLNLIQNWGAFQYYCENLITAVKKLFYTPIPDRDIVTPVLSHYVASLAICNPYFRIYVQHFIVDISEFHLFENDSIDSKTSDMDMNLLKLERLDNVYHFMAYLYLTPSGVGLSEKIQLTCFGLRNAWYVLAKVANSNSPYVELKIIVVYRFLQICGFAMMVFYQNQFVKLLNYIIVHCMPEWKKNLPTSAYPFYIRLHDLINNACVTGLFNRPKYLNKKIFPYLNRTNIPKFNDRELFCIRNFRLLYD